MRRTIALFLALLTAFLCFAICAGAGSPETGNDANIAVNEEENSGNPGNPENPENPEDPENPENPDEPEEPEIPENPDEYAEMYLITYWNVASPHVFLYFKNLTGHDITVGAYTCPKGECVSVATFGVSTMDGDGAGIYYNMERYRIAQDGKYPLVVTLKRVVSKTDLENVSKFILNNNRWEFFLFNCGWFAAKCWNAGGGSYLVPITVFPSILRLEMLFHRPIKKIDIEAAQRNEVFRQVGNGSGATLKIASDKSM